MPPVLCGREGQGQRPWPQRPSRSLQSSAPAGPHLPPTPDLPLGCCRLHLTLFNTLVTPPCSASAPDTHGTPQGLGAGHVTGAMTVKLRSRLGIGQGGPATARPQMESPHAEQQAAGEQPGSSPAESMRAGTLPNERGHAQRLGPGPEELLIWRDPVRSLRNQGLGKQAGIDSQRLTASRCCCE